MTPIEAITEIRSAVADFGEQDGVTVDRCDLALDALNSGHRTGVTLARSLITTWRNGQAVAAAADDDLLPVVAELDHALAQLEVAPATAPSILPAMPAPAVLSSAEVHLYLDVETLPTRDERVIDRIAEDVRPPGSMKKPETIATWEAEQKPAAIAEAAAKTALSGLHGHLGVIAWAAGDTEVDHLAAADVVPDGTSERDMLASFCGHVDDLAASSLDRVVIVGHNVAFDLRFILQRAVVLGVRLPRCWPREIKPWGRDVFCTMTAWAGARDYVSLDELDMACGGAGKSGVDGSMVADLVAAGRGQEVIDYCCDDVRRARRIHRKMMFAFGELNSDPHFDEMEI